MLISLRSLSISRAIFIKLTLYNHSWLRHNENKLNCCIFLLYFYTQGIGKSHRWHINWSDAGMEATTIFCVLHGVLGTLQCLCATIELEVSCLFIFFMYDFKDNSGDFFNHAGNNNKLFIHSAFQIFLNEFFKSLNNAKSSLTFIGL